jgi:hypothetical protein
VRVPFLILLLANILFLAWSLWVAAPASIDAPVAPPANPGGLRLAAESVTAATAGASGAPSGVSPAGAACVSFGPFVDPAALAEAGARLERLGYRAHTRQATEEVPSGRWVSVTDLATPEDAAHALNALRAVGLADAYVVTDATPATTISVGVFKDASRANEVATTVRAAGLEPHVTVRTGPADVSWLDVDRSANEGLPDVSALRGEAPEASPTAALEMRVCPASG